jgi:choline dehydrogenase-like flavoprotein
LSHWKEKLINKSESFLLENSQEIQPDICLWAKKPINMRKAYLSQLKKSSNISICINGSVTEIETNESGSTVEKVSVTCSKRKDTQFSVKAKYFVLACGGLENPRILLLSRKNNSSGLGNQFDVVGRYYMEHPKNRVGKIYPNQELLKSPLLVNYYYLSKGQVRFGLRLSDQIQKQEKLLNHYIMFRAGFSDEFNKAYTSLQSLILSRWMRQPQGFKQLPNHFYNIASNSEEMMRMFIELLFQKPLSIKYLTVENNLEQKPNPQSRVTLSEKRDQLGLNLLKLDWKISSEDMNDLIHFHKILKEYLQKYNLGRLESSFANTQELEVSLNLETDLTDSSHHMGATRMNNNPRRGVVNQDCQVHGIHNLFIAGSSVFPTGGHANPTLTIVALAIRLADHLKKKIS